MSVSNISSLCVITVCAHLAAHRENVEGRNGDFAKIIQQTLFLEKGANDVASGVDTTDAIRKYVHWKVGGKEGLAAGWLSHTLQPPHSVCINVLCVHVFYLSVCPGCVCINVLCFYVCFLCAVCVGISRRRWR